MQNSIKYYLCSLMNVLKNTFVCLFFPKLFPIYYVCFYFQRIYIIAFKKNFIDTFFPNLMVFLFHITCAKLVWISRVVKYFYVPHLLLLKKCNTSNTIFLKAILHICFHFRAFEIQVHFRRKYLVFSLYSFNGFSMYFQRKSDISVPPVAVLLFLFHCDVTTYINITLAISINN